MLGDIHPPKRETFDLTTRTNTDPKGINRAVDVYTVQPWGLYMARPTPGRGRGNPARPVPARHGTLP